MERVISDRLDNDPVFMLSYRGRLKMRSKAILLILLISLVFVSGCKTTFLVHDATVSQITPVFKDYVGSHGFRLSYQNEQTGSYGVDMGSVYVPYTSSTIKSSSVIAQPASTSTGQPMTAYEETTWNTVKNSDRYVQAAASVRIMQQGKDVNILIDTNDAGGSSLNDIRDYLQALGYTVDVK